MTNVIETLLTRNQSFASERFDAALKIMPKLRTLIVGCVDPRVDPLDIFGLQNGEVAVLRNIGGRITPEILLELDLLRGLAQVAGADFARGFNLVLLHHTDCGITRMERSPEPLGRFFGVSPTELETRHIHDPKKSVALDIEILRAHPSLSSEMTVSGLVYDVATGKVESVVPAATLR